MKEKETLSTRRVDRDGCSGKMATIIVSRLSWTLRKEREREKRKDRKDRNAGESSRTDKNAAN